LAKATRAAHRHEAEGYLQAAREFQAAAEEGIARRWWRAAGSASLHAAIAACDAVCVLYLGERAAGANHEEAADLLQDAGAPGGPDKAKQLRAILTAKNRIEYESRAISERESRELVKRSRRLVDWAGDTLK